MGEYAASLADCEAAILLAPADHHVLIGVDAQDGLGTDSTNLGKVGSNSYSKYGSKGRLLL